MKSRITYSVILDTNIIQANLKENQENVRQINCLKKYKKTCIDAEATTLHDLFKIIQGSGINKCYPEVIFGEYLGISVKSKKKKSKKAIPNSYMHLANEPEFKYKVAEIKRNRINKIDILSTFRRIVGFMSPEQNKGLIEIRDLYDFKLFIENHIFPANKYFFDQINHLTSILHDINKSGAKFRKANGCILKLIFIFATALQNNNLTIEKLQAAKRVINDLNKYSDILDKFSLEQIIREYIPYIKANLTTVKKYVTNRAININHIEELELNLDNYGEVLAILQHSTCNYTARNTALESIFEYILLDFKKSLNKLPASYSTTKNFMLSIVNDFFKQENIFAPNLYYLLHVIGANVSRCKVLLRRLNSACNENNLEEFTAVILDNLYDHTTGEKFDAADALSIFVSINSRIPLITMNNDMLIQILDNPIRIALLGKAKIITPIKDFNSKNQLYAILEQYARSSFLNVNHFTNNSKLFINSQALDCFLQAKVSYSADSSPGSIILSRRKSFDDSFIYSRRGYFGNSGSVLNRGFIFHHSIPKSKDDLDLARIMQHEKANSSMQDDLISYMSRQ